MGDFLEAIREFLAKLLGGSESKRQLKTLQRLKDNLSSKKRLNESSLEELKDEIQLLEERARRKKRELDKAHGDSKRIVAGEIERLFRELDRLFGRETIVAANLDRLGVALAKVGEAIVALRAGVSEEQLDEIALTIREAFDTLETLDRATSDLEREKYQAPPVSEVDADRRMAEVVGEREATTGLTPETEKRLRQLETEED